MNILFYFGGDFFSLYFSDAAFHLATFAPPFSPLGNQPRLELIWKSKSVEQKLKLYSVLNADGC